MKVHYFYLSQGVTRGPLSKDEVDQLIRVRQLHGLDLVLKETSKGIEDWTSLQEMEEFKEAFKNIAEEKEVLDWVVLVKRGKGQYLQNGPFSTKDVRAHLREGRLRYTDYAWQSGMTKWVLISELAEFKSKKKTPKIDKIDPVERGEKTLPAIPKISYAKKSTIEFNRNPFHADAGKDLKLIEIELDPDPEEKVAAESVVPSKNEEQGVVAAAETYLRPFIFEAKKKNQWMVLASLALFSFLIAVLYQVNKGSKPIVVEKREKPAQQEQIAKNQMEDLDEVAPVQESKIMKEKVEPISEDRNPPSQINFTVDKERIDILTDGSRHYPVRILIVGLPGQLQDGKLWFKSLNVKTNKGSAKIALADLNMVPGAYRIRVSTDNGLKIEKDFYYSMENKDYMSLRNKNRKDQSYWYQMDRARLVSRVAKLKDSVRQLSSQSKAKLAHLKEKDKSTEKVFFFEWEKYIELKNRAYRLSLQNKTLVQKDIQELRQEVEQLSQRLGLLSVWR